MLKKALAVGIDVGTSGVRAVAVDGEGRPSLQPNPLSLQ